MDNAYAGGGEDDFYYEQHVQDVAQDMMDQMPDEMMETAAFETPVDDIGWDILHSFVGWIGVWPFLFLAGLGALFLFKKKIKAWVREWLK